MYNSLLINMLQLLTLITGCKGKTQICKVIEIFLYKKNKIISDVLEQIIQFKDK